MATRKTLPAPRKLPLQARSRSTFEAIVQAATYILTESGWDGLTTNAIAERAGVNIGSLYQYFPNKEAVIAELQRRHVEAIEAELGRAVNDQPPPSSLRAALSRIVDSVVDEHRIAPALHRAIAEELPRAARSPQNEPLRARYLAALKPLMQNVPDPDLSLYLLGVAVHAVIHQVAAQRPALLGQPPLKEELVVMMESFLSRPSIAMP
jgi:AcrR family transcriptional regulator